MPGAGSRPRGEAFDEVREQALGIFVRTRPADGSDAGAFLSEELRRVLPAGFEAIGEALVSGADPGPACVVAGHRLACDGVSLEETLDGLRATMVLVCETEPGFDRVRTLATAWSEATLAHLHQLSCEDPLTGLASSAHARTRLSELYRLGAGGGPRETHALVVVDLGALAPGGRADVLTHAWRAARLGERARTVFSGGETIARLGSARLIVLVERDEHLGRRVDLLRRLIGAEQTRVRVWIEGLPGTDPAAGLLLDELTRL